MDPRSPTSPEQAAIAAALADAAPVGWARITLTVSATVLAYDFAVDVRMGDGGAGNISLPVEVTAGFQELRRHMYEPGRGTWFSARLVLSTDAEPLCSFNWDNDPQWWPPLLPTAFCRDLETFPRDDEHIPEWLRTLLAEGEQFDRGHSGTGV